MIGRADWPMLVICHPESDGKIPQPTDKAHLMKILFLLEKGIGTGNLGDYYNFRPYLYGPFDPAVYTDAENLAREGAVALCPDRRGGWTDVTPTRSGVDRAREIAEELHPELIDYLLRLRAWANQLSFDQLIREIYRLYPEQQQNSVFQW